jgi:hypothetical protein
MDTDPLILVVSTIPITNFRASGSFLAVILPAPMLVTSKSSAEGSYRLDVPVINFSRSPETTSGDSGDDDDNNEGQDDEGGDDDGDGDGNDGKNTIYGYDDDDGNGGEAAGGVWGQVKNWTGWTGWNGWPGNGNNGRTGGTEGEGQDEGYVVTNEDIADGNNDGDENPIESFDIAQCDTYANLWLWDLSLSCDSSASLDSCECTFTEELFAEAMITCDDINSCPAECPVCATCLKLVGCEPAPTFFQTEGVSASMILAIVSSGSLFLLAILYYVIRRRQNSREDSFGVHLLDKHQQNSNLPRGISPDKTSGPYENETMMLPFPSFHDFRSDLSSLESQTFESDHTPSTPETPFRHVMEFEMASAPPSPLSEGGDVPVVNLAERNEGTLSSPETKPASTISVAVALVPTSAAVALALARGPTSAVAPASPKTTVRNAPLSPRLSGKRAIVALPILSVEPVTAALVSTSPQSKVKAIAPPLAVAANLDVHTAVRLGQSVRHTKAVDASASLETYNPSEASSGLTSAESAQVDTMIPQETPALDGTMKTSGMAVGQETKQQDWATERAAATGAAAVSLQPSTASSLSETTMPHSSKDAVFQTTKAAAVGLSSARGDESTNGGSPPSLHEKGDDEDSESPWIGDVDLSFAPSFEEHDKPDSTEEPEQIEAAEGESAKSEASLHKSGGIDLSPSEVPTVWLVPLDDLEGETEEQEPSGDVHEEKVEEPSMVWLAPSSSSIAELVSEKKEDDNTSESSWTPDEQSGPWLVPI